MLRRFCFLFLIVLAGCVSPDPKTFSWRQDNGKLKILTTIGMIDDLVQEVGGQHVDSISLIKGELDPHSYELVKGDDEKFARADIIFYNGLGLEHGLSLRQNLENNPKACAVSDSIVKEDRSLVLIVDGQYDPHIWMDVALWVRTVDPIVEALSARDPDYAEEFRANGERLKQKMKEEDQKIFEKLQTIQSEKRFLVTSHDAFNYFTRHYLADPGEKNWKKRCEAPEGLSPEAQMSVSDIIDVIAHILTHKVSVLFPESNVSRDSLNKIMSACREKGFNIRICQEHLYGDTMGSAPSYLEMIRHNADVIYQELTKK